jgi:hypothetical protein
MFLEREELRGRAKALIPADPKIYAHLPYVIELDDEVVRTRDNGLMISLEVTGIDGITSGGSAITALRAGFGKGQFAVEQGADTPRIGAVLYVKSYVTSTWPGMLDALGARAAASGARSIWPWIRPLRTSGRWSLPPAAMATVPTAGAARPDTRRRRDRHCDR